jgi:hypothetical protein
MMETPLDVPMRVAPAAIKALTVSNSQIPPAAFTPTAVPLPHQPDVLHVCPRRTKASTRFDKVHPSVSTNLTAFEYLLIREVACFQNDLANDTRRVADFHQTLHFRSLVGRED